jgi:hypothetical protein
MFIPINKAENNRNIVFYSFSRIITLVQTFRDGSLNPKLIHWCKGASFMNS